MKVQMMLATLMFAFNAQAAFVDIDAPPPEQSVAEIETELAQVDDSRVALLEPSAVTRRASQCLQDLENFGARMKRLSLRESEMTPEQKEKHSSLAAWGKSTRIACGAATAQIQATAYQD